MPEKQITFEDIGVALKQHKSDIEARMEELKTEQSTSANAQVAELKGILAQVQKSLGDLESQVKESKSFGMPGLKDSIESGDARFDLSRFLLADYLMKASGKGNCPVVNNWDQAIKMADAAPEYSIAKEYWKKREDILNKSVVFSSHKKDYESDTGTLGGYLVPPEASSEIIDLAIAQMPLLNMPGVRRMTGLHGDLFVPTKTARGTGARHIGENSKPPKVQAAFGGVTFRPKKIGAYTKQSNRLLYQSRGTSDTIIRADLADEMALEWHRGLLNGSGADGEAKGILQYSNEMTTTVDGTTAMTSLIDTSRRFRIDHAMQLQQALDNANELRDTGTYGYMMHPQVKWGMRRERIVQYSGQNESIAEPIDGMNILINDSRLRDILGFDFKTTTQMPKDANSRSKVVFGDWSLFWAATFRDTIIRVSDVAGDGSTGSAFLDDQLYIVMFTEYDCQCMRPSAFSVISDAATLSSEW